MHVLAVTAGEGLDRSRWERVLRSGVDAFMIREPAMEARELLEAALWARDRAPELELWVNGRLDVALAAGCGLHAPEAYPPVPAEVLGPLPLSRPIHDPAQVPDRAGARQLILSPVFPVPGKGPAWGPERLGAVLDAMPPVAGRVLALGGISPANAALLRHPRLDGVALIRGLWSALDPAQVVARLREAWPARHPEPA
jgi:thiamine monophosphate synthase